MILCLLMIFCNNLRWLKKNSETACAISELAGEDKNEKNKKKEGEILSKLLTGAGGGEFWYATCCKNGDCVC